MNFVFTESLQERALASIGIRLWSQNDIRDLMSKPALHMLHNDWHVMEKAVIEKAFKLQLPKTINKNIVDFIMRIGLQILSWVDFHHCNYNFVTELPAAFAWTSLGTINNIETARLLVMSGTLNDNMSFALACMHCLEDEIKYCWNKIGWPDDELDLCFIKHWTRYMYSFHVTPISLAYLSILKPHEGFILEAATNGNVAAIRYYFKVNEFNYDIVYLSVKAVALKLCNLKKVASLHKYSSVMLFILSNLNVDDQAKIIWKFTHALLKCLLVWPWHSLFLSVAKDKWNSLSKEEYKDLLTTMVDLMRYEHNLHELFKKFWQQSPEAYKQFVTGQDDIVDLIIGLHKIKDEKNVKLILKDLSISTKRNILKEPIFKCLVSSKRWDLVRFLIQECLSSQEHLSGFACDVYKACFRKFIFSKIPSFGNFFQLTNYLIAECIKKDMEHYNTSCKKHRCKGIEE